jgi:hypothetical protein
LRSGGTFARNFLEVGGVGSIDVDRMGGFFLAKAAGTDTRMTPEKGE